VKRWKVPRCGGSRRPSCSGEGEADEPGLEEPGRLRLDQLAAHRLEKRVDDRRSPDRPQSSEGSEPPSRSTGRRGSAAGTHCGRRRRRG
jgi:hypothetical protein